MADHDKPGPLDELNARLKKAREADEAANRQRTGAAESKDGLGSAMRVGVELVAGLVVGGGIGLLLDRWLETAPWLMVVFFVLGAAAGLMNVYRTMSGMGLQAGYRKDEKKRDRD